MLASNHYQGTTRHGISIKITFYDKQNVKKETFICSILLMPTISMTIDVACVDMN
jgi:hypothetical protein